MICNQKKSCVDSGVVVLPLSICRMLEKKGFIDDEIREQSIQQSIELNFPFFLFDCNYGCIQLKAPEIVYLYKDYCWILVLKFDQNGLTTDMKYST